MNKKFLTERQNLFNTVEANNLRQGYGEGFVNIKISELTKKISKEFVNRFKDQLKTIDNGLDWRNITQKDIDKGAGFAYGNKLQPGNYVSPVKNQHVPTHSETAWIFSTTSIYSNTHKIAEVASGEKNILEAEIERINLSIQYVCDWLGSPEAKYKEDMEQERQLLIKKFGGQYRSGSFILCCKILQDIGVCVRENHNPFLSISRDKPFTNTNWYKIKQYDGQGYEIKDVGYFKNSKEISVSNDNWPSTYPGNGKVIYNSGKIYRSNVNFATPFKSIQEYGFDITNGDVEGYINYKNKKIDISYIRLNTDNIDSLEYYQELSKIMKLFIANFGPIGISINCWNIHFSTRKIKKKQFYSWKESNKDVNKWYKGEITNKKFNNKYDNSKSNHCVEIVGWTKPNNKTGRELWIIKNSWGELWGNNGYILVPMGINAYNCERHPDLLIQNKILKNFFRNIIKDIIRNTDYNTNNIGPFGKNF